ncbi:unnamed protein product [Closterium sp. Naga37s-1]|nr:unnamed protein product [Closterium sp. Naga37s-1]
MGKKVELRGLSGKGERTSWDVRLVLCCDSVVPARLSREQAIREAGDPRARLLSSSLFKEEVVVPVAEMGNKNHPNLLRLLGYCDEQDRQGRWQQVVVYEFMPGWWQPPQQVWTAWPAARGEDVVVGELEYVDPHLLLTERPTPTTTGANPISSPYSAHSPQSASHSPQSATHSPQAAHLC